MHHPNTPCEPWQRPPPGESWTALICWRCLGTCSCEGRTTKCPRLRFSTASQSWTWTVSNANGRNNSQLELLQTVPPTSADLDARSQRSTESPQSALGVATLCLSLRGSPTPCAADVAGEYRLLPPKAPLPCRRGHSRRRKHESVARASRRRRDAPSQAQRRRCAAAAAADAPVSARRRLSQPPARESTRLRPRDARGRNVWRAPRREWAPALARCRRAAPRGRHSPAQAPAPAPAPARDSRVEGLHPRKGLAPPLEAPTAAVWGPFWPLFEPETAPPGAGRRRGPKISARAAGPALGSKQG
eukprot:scaffold1535_cov382-Prasinococcus_capsulatus_cf.AAC.56